MSPDIGRRPLASAIFAAALIALTLVASWRDGSLPASAQQAPPFDDFAAADYWYEDYQSGADVFPLARVYSNAGATLEPGEAAPCASVGATLWMRYYSDRSGTLDIATHGSGFNTVLAVYVFDNSGQFLPSPPGGNLRSVACNDDADNAFTSRVTLPIERDREYLVQVGGRDGAAGEVRIQANCDCTPPNDNLDRARGLYFDAYQQAARHAVDTRTATTQPGEPLPCGNIGRTVWYTFWSNQQDQALISTEGSDFDTVIAVYKGNEIGPFDALVPVACVNDTAATGAAASLALQMEPNTQYQVQVGGANGAGGQLRISAGCQPACRPHNDNALSAEQHEPPVEGIVSFTDGATLDDGEPQPCANIGKTVWYAVVVHGDTRIIAEATGVGFDAVIAAYENTGFSPPPENWRSVDCEAASQGGTARVEFVAKANIGYLLQVGGRAGAGGELHIEFDCDPDPCPPFNDSLAYPWTIQRPYDTSYTYTVDTRGATSEEGEDTDCGDMDGSVWFLLFSYYWESTAELDISTEGSDFDAAIAVYNPTVSSPIMPDFDAQVLCAAGGPGQRASVHLTTRPNEAVYLQVGGRNGTGGMLELTVTCNPACPPFNDNQGTPTPLNPDAVMTANTISATLEPGEPRPCENIGRTVWYQFFVSPGADHDVVIDTAGSDFPAAVAVYAIHGFSSPPGGAETVACGSGAVSFRAGGDTSYFVQAGGVDDAGGMLSIERRCTGACPVVVVAQPLPGYVVGPDNAPIPAAGAVRPPDTGSGGYLPGAGGP